MRDVPIAIVGAGAVGSTIALLLAKQGIRPLVLEASAEAPAPQTPPRVVALARGSVALLEELGVLPCEIGARLDAIFVSDAAGGELLLDARDHGLDFFGCVVDLDRLVGELQRAAEQDAIDWLRPAPVQGLAQEREAVVLTAGEHRIRARLVIGCDGAGARLARLAGWRFLPGWPHNRFAFVGVVETTRPAFGLAVERFLPDGPLALLPMADRRYAFVWALPPRCAARLQTAEEDAVLAEMAAALGEAARARVGEMRRLASCDVVELELLLAPPAVRGRVWLAGAGAHHLHPVAGQGLNLGLRDARTIAEVLQLPPAKRDAGARILGEHYLQRRAPDVAATVGLTEGLLSLFGCQLPGAGLARAFGMRAFKKLAPLERAFVRRLAAWGS